MKLKKFLAIAATVLLTTACGGGDPTPSVFYLVTYLVTGSGTSTASITYASAGGGTSQADVTLPYSSFPMISKPGDFLYISAQNKSSSGTVAVTIKADNATFKSTSSTGAYVIATASGSCC